MRAGADHIDQSPIKLRDYNPIMVRVSDEQPIAFLISQNFAGKCEWQITYFRFLKHQFERRFVQFAAFAKLCDGVADYFIKGFVTTFTR